MTFISEALLMFGCFACIELVRQAYFRFFRLNVIPKNIPWAGDKNGLFARTRAILSSVGKTPELSTEGYYKYSKNDKPYVLPCLMTGPEVILPPSQLRWLLTQPEDVLSQRKAAREFFEGDHTMFNPSRGVLDSVRTHVIRQDLSRELPKLFPDLKEEMEYAFEQTWGTNTEEWREIALHESMKNIISRMHNRVFVGLPVCRNEKYLQHCRGFLRYLALLSGIINLWPRWLKPVIAPIVTIGDRYHYSICEKILRPYIAERMRALERQMEDPSPNYSEPNTSLQWTVNEAYRCWDRSEWTPAKLASRIIVFIIVTFQVTAIALTNAIFDTAASPNAQSFFSKLREESEREFDAEGGTWTLESLSRMTKIDSALRESLRMNGGASSRGPTKEVIAPEGITLPDGTHVPQGVKIGVSSFTIHHDASIYSDPWSFDPFRFSRPCKEDIEDMKQDYGVEVQAAPGEANGIPNHKNEALVSKTAEVKKGPTLVTTSAEFMGFGHGRWACPGRFYSSVKMKLVMAYMVKNYDIEQLDRRPQNHWFGSSTAPPFESIVRIRRRPEKICTAKTQKLAIGTANEAVSWSGKSPRDVQGVIPFYRNPSNGRVPTVDEIDTKLIPETTNAKELVINDIRGSENKFTLDENGFQVVRHKSQVSNYSDEDQVRKTYYPEMEQLIQTSTGCLKVVIWNHKVRYLPRSVQSAQTPSLRPHIDLTPNGAKILLDQYISNAAPPTGTGRIQMINAWRPIKTIRRDPFAVADATTVPDTDLAGFSRVNPDGQASENYFVKHGEQSVQRWYYVNEQKPDEVLLFKLFDSNSSVKATRTPHCSFIDRANETMDPRESIEIRAALWY